MEWWNLDQALIWMETRDLALVESAEGDAAGARDRQYNYWALVSEEAAEEVEEDHPSQARHLRPHEVMLQLLRRGQMPAFLAHAERDTQVSPRVFVGCQIEWNGENGNAQLAKSQNKLSRAKGRPIELLDVLLRKDSVIEIFPCKAPESIQSELKDLLRQTAPEQAGPDEHPEDPRAQHNGRPLSDESARAEQIFREAPEKIPRRGGQYGTRKGAIRKVQEQLEREGLGNVSTRTIMRAARRAETP